MARTAPVVRHMLLCEDVRSDANNPHRVNILGLVSKIEVLSDPPFPLRLPELCVYLLMTDERGRGQASIVGVHADSGQAVFASPERNLQFGADPLAVVGVIFRIEDCVFPEAGLYWIQFVYNGQVIAQQPLLVR